MCSKSTTHSFLLNGRCVTNFSCPSPSFCTLYIQILQSRFSLPMKSCVVKASPVECWLTLDCLLIDILIDTWWTSRLNSRIPGHLLASHWIRIATIVIYLVLQIPPTHVNKVAGYSEVAPTSQWIRILIDTCWHSINISIHTWSTLNEQSVDSRPSVDQLVCINGHSVACLWKLVASRLTFNPRCW